MSDEPSQPGGGTPYASIALVVAAIGALFFSRPSPFIDTRPDSSGAGIVDSLADQDIDARLWQDPLGAIIDPAASGSASNSRNGSNYCDTPKRTSRLHSQAPLMHDATDILMVLVPGGPYGEAEEQRRRVRQAVVEALSSKNFHPLNEERIGCWFTELSFTSAESGAQKINTSLSIPFEKYVDFDKEKLVLWIDEDRIDEQPLRQLMAIADTLNNNLKTNNPKTPAGKLVAKSSPESVNVVGPFSSRILTQLVKNLSPKDGQSASNTDCALIKQSIKFFAYAPTAEINTLNEYKTIFCLGDKSALKDSANVNELHVEVNRTVMKDKDLSKELTNELERRDVFLNAKPCGKVDRIRYIYEIDTDYGRQIPENIDKALSSGCPFKVTWYGYLRGLDGIIPGMEKPDAKPKQNSTKQDDEDNRKASDGTIERAEGQSQFDYLRRLAARLKEDSDKARRKSVDPTADGQSGENRNEPITAIGVFGSDVYDKLQVLQALRPEFPDAVFFTTDLDARLFEPRHLKWTRGLVIASSYDLQLSDRLQGSVPPFRGSYQTAAFLSTLMAVGPFMQGVNDVKQARLFEVTDDGVTRLRSSGDDNNDKLNDLYPDFSRLYPRIEAKSGQGSAGGRLFLAFVLWIILMLLAGSTNYHVRIRDEVSAGKITGGDAFVWLVLIKAGLLLVSLLLAETVLIPFWNGLGRYLTEDGLGSKLWPVDGTSLWPSILVRILAGGVEIYFITKIAEFNTRNIAFIQKELYLPDSKVADGCRSAILGTVGAIAKSLWYNDVSVDKAARGRNGIENLNRFWMSYGAANRTSVLLVRVFVFLAIVVTISLALFLLFSMEDPPHRGALVRSLHRVISITEWGLMLFLVILVGDLAWRFRKFVDDLKKAPVSWPNEAGEKEYHLDNALINELSLFQFTGWRSDMIIKSTWYIGISLLIHVVLATGLVSVEAMPVPVVASVAICFAVVVLVQVVLCVGLADPIRARLLLKLKQAVAKVAGQSGSEGTLTRMRNLVEYVANYDEGAFRPIWRQSFVGALALPTLASAPALIQQFLSP